MPARSSPCVKKGGHNPVAVTAAGMLEGSGTEPVPWGTCPAVVARGHPVRDPEDEEG